MSRLALIVWHMSRLRGVRTRTWVRKRRKSNSSPRCSPRHHFLFKSRGIRITVAAAASAQVRPASHMADSWCIFNKTCSGACDCPFRSCHHVLGRPLPGMSFSVTQHEELHKLNLRNKLILFLYILIFDYCATIERTVWVPKQHSLEFVDCYITWFSVPRMWIQISWVKILGVSIFNLIKFSLFHFSSCCWATIASPTAHQLGCSGGR